MTDPVADAVTRWLDRWPGGGPVVVACSGGADSLALAAAVLGVLGPAAVAAVTVDHGLQPGSAARAADTRDALLHLGFRSVEVATVRVEGPGGPEAAARRARYAALRPHARPNGAVLLGHTADDQAETVLLGLARGSGPRSIAGMQPWRPPWGRPLLGVRRRDTLAACRAAGLAPWDDPHNADPRFTRARLRHEVLPLLDEVLGGGVVGALARTAELLADDLAALDALADAALAEARAPDGALDTARLMRWPRAVRTRALRAWALHARTGALTAEHLRRLDALVLAGRTGAAVRLPGGRDVRRDGGVLRVDPPPDAATSGEVGDHGAGWQA